MRRGYLLPKGCKDLIDVLNLKSQPKAELPPFHYKSKVPRETGAPVLPILGEITVTEPMTVADLATVLKQKPYLIVADLLELGVFASVNQEIPFEMIARVAQKHGYIAKKAP